MEITDIAYIPLGIISGFTIGNYVEHRLHEKVLHCDKPDEFSKYKILNDFVRNAARGHHIIHHPGFDPNTDYFANAKNKDLVSHFSKSDVGLILTGAASIGVALSQASRLVVSSPGYSSKDTCYIVGFTTGAAIYYGLYEGSHHLMHFLGETRSEIGYKIGDGIQGNQPDGKLRLSIPLMTGLANGIERNIDRHAHHPDNFRTGLYSNELIQRLKYEIDFNRTKSKEHPFIGIEEGSEGELIDNVTAELLDKENKKISKLSKIGYLKHKTIRLLSRQIRESPTYQSMERHHLLHHVADNTNLNVVVPWPDIIRGTKVKSDEGTLMSKSNLWHLPNPLPLERLVFT